MARDIGAAESEPLAIGARILGADGGGSPNLSYLNMLQLYPDFRNSIRFSTNFVGFRPASVM